MSDFTLQQPDNNAHEGAAAPATGKTITKRDLNRAWWIWTFFNLSAFSMERMQAPAFVYMMSPIIKRLYSDNPEEIKSALKRHMVFFNTEPQTGVIAHGVTVALEQQRASGAPINDEMINGIKAGIMGPMAGIGDSMIPGTLIPILSESEALTMKPDYLFVLPWHFRDNLIQRESAFLRHGGKMIFPLPALEIYSE